MGARTFLRNPTSWCLTARANSAGERYGSRLRNRRESRDFGALGLGSLQTFVHTKSLPRKQGKVAGTSGCRFHLPSYTPSSPSRTIIISCALLLAARALLFQNTCLTVFSCLSIGLPFGIAVNGRRKYVVSVGGTFVVTTACTLTWHSLPCPQSPRPTMKQYEMKLALFLTGFACLPTRLPL